ncbi:peptide deformylase [Stackebrandtia nassauensis]|uniref:Peptide deformylase n=1 Tax=Stackebrandtia nassauensis (strain DSM 44728 / CIP 108903 / NRRL B-16338 / NBRC 102104 / LLR-40K-21) TaxID=446470 RepID=D3PYV7_STANL|nr:peptide deformylase [Stackebrandtia nassauensis]ADD43540.1 peptide deformylase [Stackebrandtia nassauensis DSM 44728]
MTETESGTVHDIVYHGTEVLHRRCRTVTDFDDELARLVDDMFASMYAANGVGLAANQIGVDARVFVIDCRDDDGGRLYGHIVNPTLREEPPPRELNVGPEGCLSVPGQYADVARTQTATVDGFDKTGKPITLTSTGEAARCLQHETDHLNGIVYVDKLPKKIRKRLLAEAGLG